MRQEHLKIVYDKDLILNIIATGLRSNDQTTRLQAAHCALLHQAGVSLHLIYKHGITFDNASR